MTPEQALVYIAGLLWQAKLTGDEREKGNDCLMLVNQALMQAMMPPPPEPPEEEDEGA